MEPGGAAEEKGNTGDVACEAQVPVVLVKTKTQRIGDGIFLRIDLTACNGVDQVSNIRKDRLETKSPKGILIQLVVEGTNNQS